jgi:hypothetical protein
VDTQLSIPTSPSEFSWDELRRAWDEASAFKWLPPQDREAMERAARSFRAACGGVEDAREDGVLKREEMPA